MTSEPTAAAARHARALPYDKPHQHHGSCYWDVDECRWRCMTYPLLGNAVQCCTGTGRSVARSGAEARP